MDRQELVEIVQQQRAQLEQLAFQKHSLEKHMQQLQGNIDATYGSIQMLEQLLGMSGPEETDEARETVHAADSDD